MGFPSPMELIIIFAIILLLFGANKMPQMARSLGKSMREFKKAQRGIANGLQKDITNPSPPEAEEGRQEEKPSTTSSGRQNG